MFKEFRNSRDKIVESVKHFKTTLPNLLKISIGRYENKYSVYLYVMKSS